MQHSKTNGKRAAEPDSFPTLILLLFYLLGYLSWSLTHALTSPVSSYKDAVLLHYVSGSLPPLLDAKGKEPKSGRAS